MQCLYLRFPYRTANCSGGRVPRRVASALYVLKCPVYQGEDGGLEKSGGGLSVRAVISS